MFDFTNPFKKDKEISEYSRHSEVFISLRKKQPLRVKLLEAAAVLGILIIMIVMSTMFFMKQFNVQLNENMDKQLLTLDTVRQRYEFSSNAVDDEIGLMKHMLETNNQLQLSCLNHTSRDKWKEAMDVLLTDGKGPESYYYYSNVPLFQSSNAIGLNLTEEQINTLEEEGFLYIRSEDHMNDEGYYMSKVGQNGRLITAYRYSGLDDAFSVRNPLNATQVIDDGGIIIYDKETDKVYVSSAWDLEGKSVDRDTSVPKDITIDEYVFSADEEIKQTGSDTYYNFFELLSKGNEVRVRSADINDRVRIVTYQSIKASIQDTAEMMAMPLIFFIIIVLGFGIAVWQIKILRDQIRERSELIHLFKDKYIDKVLVKRLFLLFVVSLIIIVISCGYITILNRLSAANIDAAVDLENIDKEEKANLEASKSLIEFRDKCNADLFGKMINVIDSKDYYRTDEGLAELVRMTGINQICLFNSAGVSIAASDGKTGYTLSYEDSDNKSSPLWNVLSSETDKVNQCIDEKTGLSYFAAKCKTVGMARFEYLNTTFVDSLSRINEDAIMIESDFGESDIMYFDSDYPDKLYIAESGSHEIAEIDMPFDSSVLSDGYFGLNSINGNSYFINARSDSNFKGNYFISALKIKHVIRKVISILTDFIRELAALTVILTAAFSICTVKQEGMLVLKKEDESSDGSEGNAQAAASGSDEEPDESYKEKLRLYDLENDLLGKMYAVFIKIMFYGCIAAFAVFLFVSLVGETDRRNLIRYLFVSDWKRGFNIFSLTMILILVILLSFATSLLSKLIGVVSENMGPSGLTVGRLVASLVRFAGLLGSVLIILEELGFNTNTILASAGLTSVVIGIGAQSTVRDILTGIFIIFEGNFRVGDIVLVNGWTGKISEIGVRTISLESYGYFDNYKNIRVINNSDFNNVINLSRKPSQAIALIPIPYEADLAFIDKLFRSTAAEIADKFSEIHDGPFYDGVIRLDDSAKIIRFRVACAEADRTLLERLLMQTYCELLESNGISVPYNQLVIHKASDGQ